MSEAETQIQTDAEQSDNTAPTMAEVSDALDTINAALDEGLESKDDLRDDAESNMTGDLVETLATAKGVEKQIEDFRKTVVQAVLDTRMKVGDSFEAGDIRATRVEGHNKYVSDDGELLAAFEEAGVDTEEVLEVNATDAYKVAMESEELNADELIGKYTYDYYRC